jgi:hypothetical protein
MDEVRKTLEALVDLGHRHFFRLRDGTPFEGWIEELDDVGLTFVSETRALDVYKGPTITEETFRVMLKDIDLTTLAYLSNQGWLDYP